MALHNLQRTDSDVETNHNNDEFKTYLNQITRQTPQPFKERVKSGVPGVPVLCLQASNGENLIFQRQPIITIGRRDVPLAIYPTMNLGEHNGLELGVSRRHAKLVYVRDKFHVMDLGSTNGTRLNDKLIPPQQMIPIYENDKLTFGSLNLYVVWISQD